MNWRLAPAVEKARLRMSEASSQGSTPWASSLALIAWESVRAKTASTVQLSAPERMRDLSARSPRMSLRAPTMIDFPAPVSPVTAVKPGVRIQVSSSTRARLRMRSEVRVAGTGE